MKAYPEYKRTGEVWLQSIPAHWEMRKIKFLFNERSEKGYPNEPLLVASQNMGVVPKRVYGNRTVEAQKDLHLLKLVRIGDFVISLRSFQGGIEYAYYQGIISPAYTIMVSKGIIKNEYFKFLAKSYLFIELLKICVTGIREGQNIDYTVLKNQRIPVPPITEQIQIASFLDWKLSNICKLIPYKDMTTYFIHSNAILAKEFLLISEYKRKLISDIITGQIDVRKVEIPEYETVEEIDEVEDETLSSELESDDN